MYVVLQAHSFPVFSIVVVDVVDVIAEVAVLFGEGRSCEVCVARVLMPLID